MSASNCNVYWDYSNLTTQTYTGPLKGILKNRLETIELHTIYAKGNFWFGSVAFLRRFVWLPRLWFWDVEQELQTFRVMRLFFLVQFLNQFGFYVAEN